MQRNYCFNNVQIEEQNLTVDQCAESIKNDKRCQGGKGLFVHSESMRYCSCCTDGNALENTQVPLLTDMHIYRAKEETEEQGTSKWCQQSDPQGRRCEVCEPNGQFCTQC